MEKPEYTKDSFGSCEKVRDPAGMSRLGARPMEKEVYLRLRGIAKLYEKNLKERRDK